MQRKTGFLTPMNSGKNSARRFRMRLHLLIFIILAFGVSVFGQIDNVNTGSMIEKLYLARDDGTGQIGDTTDKFLVSDIPIHCVVELNTMKPVTVKLNFVAVKVLGVKPESKVISTEFTTNGMQSKVNFTGKPDKRWIAGDYRIDIFIDEKLAGNIEFKILRSPLDLGEEKVLPFKAKSKIIKKLRKN